MMMVHYDSLSKSHSESHKNNICEISLHVHDVKQFFRGFQVNRSQLILQLK